MEPPLFLCVRMNQTTAEGLFYFPSTERDGANTDAWEGYQSFPACLHRHIEIKEKKETLVVRLPDNNNTIKVSEHSFCRFQLVMLLSAR